jgi:hypothetical protein
MPFFDLALYAGSATSGTIKPDYEDLSQKWQPSDAYPGRIELAA